jgi:hypothetical protein
MKRKLGSVFTALLVALVTVPARPAGAAKQISVFQLRDHSLIADFADASDDGCFVIQTDIHFFESVTHIGGPPIIGPPTTVVVLDYANACTGESFELTGGTTQQTFHIAHDLSSATLTAVVPVVDESGSNSASVNLNVTWTANAPAQEVKSRNITRSGNTLTIERFDVTARTADVTGPVSAVLDVEAGPTSVDLSRFPEGGQLGTDVDGQRTVTFLHGHHP